MEAVAVAGLDVTKDHGSADNQGDDVTDGPDLFADGNDTDGEAHGKTSFDSLLDDAADQEDEDTAGLIALDGLDCFFGGGSRSNDDDEARDIAGNQRNTELTDFCVDEVTMIVGAFVRSVGLDVFASLDHFSRDGSADAGLEDGVGARLTEHHCLDIGKGVLQLADGRDLLADVCIDTCQAVRGRGHGQGGVAADFGNDLVNFFFGLGEHLVRAVEDAFKQCLHCGFIPFRFILWRRWQP